MNKLRQIIKQAEKQSRLPLTNDKKGRIDLLNLFFALLIIALLFIFAFSFITYYGAKNKLVLKENLEYIKDQHWIVQILKSPMLDNNGMTVYDEVIDAIYKDDYSLIGPTIEYYIHFYFGDQVDFDLVIDDESFSSYTVPKPFSTEEKLWLYIPDPYTKKPIYFEISIFRED